MGNPLWLEGVAVAAAVVSSGVIAWQAVLTRRSVKSSDKTVQVAERALRESQLSRLENQVPRILVSADPRLYALEIRSRTPRTTGGGRVQWAAVGEEERFHLPKDARVMLAIDFEFEVRNDGPGSVLLDMTPRARSSNDDGSYILGPNESRTYKTVLSHSVATWVSLAQSPKNEKPNALSQYAECMSIRIEYKGPRDADIDELHEIKLFGTIVEEDSEAKGSWVPANALVFAEDIQVVVLPAKRTYWKSRAAGMQYEDI